MTDAPATSWAVWAWQAYKDGRLVEATKANDATIKAVADLIAQEHGWTRTDMIQPMIDAAVAAALERAAVMLTEAAMHGGEDSQCLLNSADTIRALIQREGGRKVYMGQIMAECDCPREAECQAAGRCIAEGRR